MTDETTKPRTMCLVLAKEKYSSKAKPITLVDNQADAAAIRKLLERSESAVEIIDVPIWPEMLGDE